MYSYKNNKGELVTITLEELISIANSNKNLINLSIKLNSSMETARSILEDLDKMNNSNLYRIEQYNKWTEEVDAQLEKEYRNNLTIKQISEIHGRTLGAIRSRLKHKNLYISNTEIKNITTKEKNNISGMFRIRFDGDNRDEVYFYNIEEKEDNIDPTRPIFNELFKTEIGEYNDKYGFTMLDKSQLVPEKKEESEEKKKIDISFINSLNIYHLTDYIPKWCNRNDNNSYRILALKNRDINAVNFYYNLTYKWLKEHNFLNENIIIAVIPSHLSNEENISGIADIAKKIIQNSKMQNGINLIIRKTSINKKATSMYMNRPSLNQDINSLKINSNIEIRDKTIIILDDVTTHGDSFKAAAYHLFINGAKKVVPLAIGKTVIPNE